jgi:hypothetical protein
LEWQLRPTRGIGWNRGVGGGLARFGYRATETAKQNMREAAKRKPAISDEAREKLRIASTGRTNRGRIGQKQSEDAKAKISAGNTGKRRTDEMVRKMSERMLGQKLHLGHSHSERTKQLIRAKKSGLAIHSEEEKCKRAERMKGNALTKGKPWSAARRLAWLQHKET